MVTGIAEDIVATDDADEDRAGDAGCLTEEGAGDNGGREVGAILTPEGVDVGLGDDAEIGVVMTEFPVNGPLYFSPNSPGENMTTEQKPSVEVMRRVSPSDDHVRSVNAA